MLEREKNADFIPKEEEKIQKKNCLLVHKVVFINNKVSGQKDLKIKEEKKVDFAKENKLN